jgi:Na+/citrate or Na+/malate symporter
LIVSAPREGTEIGEKTQGMPGFLDFALLGILQKIAPSGGGCLMAVAQIATRLGGAATLALALLALVVVG